MKRPGRCASVADGGGADNTADVPEPTGEQHAVDHRDHRAEMADHGKESLPGTAAMDVAIASAHRSQGRSEIGANRVQDRFAESQPAGLVANKGSEDVSFAQRKADGHAQRLLSASEKNAAMNLAGAVEANELIVQRPCQQHPAKRFCVFLSESGDNSAGVGADHSLNHAGYLPAFALPVQTFLYGDNGKGGKLWL